MHGPMQRHFVGSYYTRSLPCRGVIYQPANRCHRRNLEQSILRHHLRSQSPQSIVLTRTRKQQSYNQHRPNLSITSNMEHHTVPDFQSAADWPSIFLLWSTSNNLNSTCWSQIFCKTRQTSSSMQKLIALQKLNPLRRLRWDGDGLGGCLHTA